MLRVTVAVRSCASLRLEAPISTSRDIVLQALGALKWRILRYEANSIKASPTPAVMRGITGFINDFHFDGAEITLHPSTSVTTACRLSFVAPGGGLLAHLARRKCVKWRDSVVGEIARVSKQNGIDISVS